MLLCEPVEDIDELVEPLRAFRFTLRDALRHALLYMTAYDGEADAIERRLGGRQLLEYFDTQPGLFDHAPNAADLAFDTVQAGDQRLLLRWVQHTALYVTLEIGVSYPVGSIFDKGAGPPLIVIPGVQGRWEWVRPALDHLQSRCRTISYSLCGDLGSACTQDPARGFDNYLDQLDRVFETAGVERAALCGISYGGFIALRYAASRPERVSALAIVSSPAPGWTPNPIQSAYIASPLRATPRFILSSPVRLWPEIRAAFATPMDRVSFILQHGLRVAAAPMNPTLMAGRIAQQQQMDFCPDCARVRVPALIVTGEPELDKVVPVESTRRYVDMIPGARYALMERTGHLGLVTQPGKFAALVGNFVREYGVT